MYKKIIKFFHNIFSFFNTKFKITENAKASGGGERLTIRSWKYAENSKDFILSHVQRYKWASPYVKNLKCLDVGCGCGYGTHYLSRNNPSKIVGIDISPNAIKFAKKYYKENNLEFFAMSALDLKFENDHFNTVICFEMLEHVREEEQYKLLTEISKVIKGDGVLCISSPNAKIHRGGYPFHYKELTVDEFREFLHKFFIEVEIFGQDLIIDKKRQGDNWRKYQTNLSAENFVIVKDDIESCYGLLAICKNKLK